MTCDGAVHRKATVGTNREGHGGLEGGVLEEGTLLGARGRGGNEGIDRQTGEPS